MFDFITRNTRRKKAAERALLKREKLPLKKSSLRGQLEILREQISVIQEKETSSLRYFQIMFFVFSGIGLFGSYKLNEVVNSVTVKTTELVSETRDEIRYLSDRARPQDVFVARTERGDKSEIPGILSLSHKHREEDNSPYYIVKITFYPSITVEEYSASFIGWFVSLDGGILDWFSRTNSFSIFATPFGPNEIQRQYIRDRNIAGQMSYHQSSGITRPVTITPSAPYTGTFSLSWSTDECEIALRSITEIMANAAENGNFGTIFLSPSVDNYTVIKPTEFIVDMSSNTVDDWNCEFSNNNPVKQDDDTNGHSNPI
ncbi:MAG: hypothetical protein GQ535_11990 [Rhodobacteraceae bacterium]|nr:hypothetical protein [Paracoccaceae bacterium]